MKKISKIASLLLALLMLVNTAYAAELGDGDGDTLVTATDAAMAYAKMNNQNLDVNGDGSVDEKDAELILSKALNYSESFSVASTEKPAESSTEKPAESTTSSTETSTEGTTESTTSSTESTTESTTVDQGYNKTWNMSDSSFSSLGDITANQTVDGLELLATAEKTMAVAARNKTVDGVSYTMSLNLSGTGSTSSRAVAFDVSGSTDLTVVLQSGNSSEVRTLIVADSEGNELTTISAPTAAEKATININYTGKVYLYSKSSGIHIFAITRSSAGGSSEESTESTTESTTGSEETTESTTAGTVSDQASYGVQGFAKAGLSGLDVSGYTVYTADSAAAFLSAVDKANKNGNAVIKVTADLNLGYNEVSGSYSCFKSSVTPLLHPTLMTSGVSQVTIKGKNIVIYSPNGNAIKHTNVYLSGASNVVIRNLTFSELWEWDEYSLGHYDRNDWDYICVDESTNVWVDHCTFGKSYDGVVDSKNASTGFAVTWCKFDSEIDKEFVKAQFDYLETNLDKTGSSITITNKTGSAINSLGLTSSSSAQTTTYAYPLYRYLRKEVGLTVDEVIAGALPQQKTHLIGHSNNDSNMSKLEATFAYNYYKNSRDRIPRLRGGNAHIYNSVIDSSTINTVYNKYKSNSAFKNIGKVVANTSEDDYEFAFSSTSQAFLSTMDGALSAENCVVKGVMAPVKNNQNTASNTAQTGKFRGLNILVDGTVTTWDGSQNAIDNDTSNALYPQGADVAKVFSWNSTANYSTDAVSFTAVDVNQLEGTLTGNVGAGVANIDWTKMTY